MREGTHVAGALHIVLSTERIDTHAVAADVAGGHGEVRHAHDHGGALAVLGDAEAVVDGAIAARGIEPGRGADFGSGNAGHGFERFGRVALFLDEGLPAGEFHGIAALVDEGAVLQPFGEDDMGDAH